MTQAIFQFRFLLILLVVAWCSELAHGQASEGPAVGNESAAPPTTAEVLKKVDQLVQQNQLLEKQNRELMDQITTMRQVLTAKPSDEAAQAEAEAQALRQAIAKETQPAVAEVTPPKVTYASFSKPLKTSETLNGSVTTMPRPIASDGMPLAGGMGQGEEGPTNWGTYKTNLGFKVADTEHGDLSISLYSYGRYLNQKALEPTYTSYFGVTSTLQQRQDFPA